MSMPNNYILIRHGESEGNVATNAFKRGDETLYTDKYVTTPGAQWVLTDRGIAQARAMGLWLQENLPPIDRYYVSPYVRTRMTAVSLQLPNAQWSLNRSYREREYGEIERLPRSIFQKDYPNSALIRKTSPLYWCPPGGESIADVGENRIRNILDTLHRECENKNVLAVTHGENMWAHRLILERWSDEKYEAMDADKSKKIHNCTVIWYRKNPDGPQKHLDQYRIIEPLEMGGEFKAHIKEDWTNFNSSRYSNEDLWETVKDVASMFSEN